MFKELIGKLAKTELWVTLLGMIAALLATKMGLPEEQLQTLLMSISGLAVTYVAGRSYAKPRENGFPPKNP